jgi:hypothetical protein
MRLTSSSVGVLGGLFTGIATLGALKNGENTEYNHDRTEVYHLLIFTKKPSNTGTTGNH